jgi:hypothetical protein
MPSPISHEKYRFLRRSLLDVHVSRYQTVMQLSTGISFAAASLGVTNSPNAKTETWESLFIFHSAWCLLMIAAITGFYCLHDWMASPAKQCRLLEALYEAQTPIDRVPAPASKAATVAYVCHKFCIFLGILCYTAYRVLSLF